MNEGNRSEDVPQSSGDWANWLEAVANATDAAVNATEEVAVLWPDVRQLILEATRTAEHPEALALYETIRQHEDCVVEQTKRALDSAQAAIDAVRQADFEIWLRRIRGDYKTVDPLVFANERTLERAKEAQHVAETVPIEVMRHVSMAHLDVYDLPQWHCEVLAAYLGRPTNFRRALSGTAAVLKAAASDSVPYLGTVMEARNQLAPQIKRELAAVPDQVKSYNRALYFRDAVRDLCQLSRVVWNKIDKVPKEADSARQRFHEAAAWLVTLMERGAKSSSDEPAV